MDLWMFGVKNKFAELAAYSLTNSSVKREIVQILRNPEKGLRWFLEEKTLPLAVMQKVVAGVASSSSWERDRISI
jgi:hypothetical protein